ncbi:Tex family protein [Oceaniglobus roseus]|uniref:Tex family protein n=1 Tax=Oceaniglobus roseus TaxID=1737570 RepID=UPI000C7EE646|nr:Tex family protein [Kandeliimicrobium roseum]
MDRTNRITEAIRQEIGAAAAQVAAAIRLLDEGATVPFIARYRKEATGGLDDTQLRTLAERLTYLRELDARRDAILRSIREQDKLTPDLTRAIEAAETKSRLEDIYLPFKPKRRTRAMIAREKGLGPLRDAILANRGKDPEALAKAFVGQDVADTNEALDGARDILIEELAETADLIGDLRKYLEKEAVVSARVVKGKEEEGAKFADYFDRTESLARLPAHRALALMRAVGEGIVRFDIGPDPEVGKPRCESMVAARLRPSGNGPGDAWLRDVARHAWKTKISTAMTIDLLADLRARAHEEAIAVFARNLKDLLLAAPAGARPTLGLDPGIRTGVKAAVIDATGKVLQTATLYPFQPRMDLRGAQAKIVELVRRHGIELIAIGNGTASRETERMVEETLKALPGGTAQPTKVIVSEAGASVYSASELAAKEFPDLDVSLRGAVSIARRLQDPLSELVKIEPNAIGVGQYQHDVDQRRLAKALEAVVEDAVNAVGVDLNTASAALLSHVAGLTPTLAANIVAHRDGNGPFRARKELLKVKGLGPKAFEQCAGFLRIRDGKEPLDASSVHPEAYDLARRIVIACGRDLRAIQSNPDSLRRGKPETFVTDTFGLPTVRDILQELEKPGRDPRPSFRTATFAEGVNEITDLREGMRLEGTVTNVAAFGAFVDIGVHQDGLVHVSQLADRFVKDPHEVVKAGDVVQVRVTEVDVARKRIGLSMRADGGASAKQERAARAPTGANPRRERPPKQPSAPRGGKPEAPGKSGDAPGALGSALLEAMKKR